MFSCRSWRQWHSSEKLFFRDRFQLMVQPLSGRHGLSNILKCTYFRLLMSALHFYLMWKTSPTWFVNFLILTLFSIICLASIPKIPPGKYIPALSLNIWLTNLYSFPITLGKYAYVTVMKPIWLPMLWTPKGSSPSRVVSVCLGSSFSHGW